MRKERKSRLKQEITQEMKDFADRLKKLRIEQKLSLKEVASRIGISSVTLSRYENLDIVNIPSDKIELLAEVYHVSPAYLMGWENRQHEPTPQMAPYTLHCTETEKNLIQKYRKLTQEGKETVLTILNLQYKAACPRPQHPGKDEVG